MEPATHNLTLGQEIERALEKAAQAKNEALLREKLAKRVYAECYLRARGANIEERKNNAALEEAYTAREDEWVAAESAANLAKAKVEGLQVRFNEWQTREASRRVEMGLR